MLPGLIGELAPVDPGQPDIGDQQVDALARLQDLEARRSVRRLQRPVAQILQNLDDQVAHDRLVLDHQHGLARLCARRVGSVTSDSASSSAAPR